MYPSRVDTITNTDFIIQQHCSRYKLAKAHRYSDILKKKLKFNRTAVDIALDRDGTRNYYFVVGKVKINTYNDTTQ